MLLSFFWNLFIIKLEIPNTVFILKKHVQWQVSCDAVQGVRIRAVNLPSLKFENPKNQRNVASDQNCEDFWITNNSAQGWATPRSVKSWQAKEQKPKITKLYKEKRWEPKLQFSPVFAILCCPLFHGWDACWGGRGWRRAGRCWCIAVCTASGCALAFECHPICESLWPTPGWFIYRLRNTPSPQRCSAAGQARSPHLWSWIFQSWLVLHWATNSSKAGLGLRVFMVSAGWDYVFGGVLFKITLQC